MTRHTLYAYVHGNDIGDVAPVILTALQEFVDSRRWARATWVVDQIHPREPSMRPEDLTDRDLGLNHELPDPSAEGPDWFDDIRHLALRLVDLAASTGREFVLGLHDDESGLGEDIFLITGAGVDIAELRVMLGDGRPGASS